jgi:hypothetical protein
MKGVLSWLVRWARQRACARVFCPALAVLQPVKKVFSSSDYFTSFVPIAQQAGQAVVPRRLSLNMCLRASHFKWP